MKFLILALCVCAASAGFPPFSAAKAVASVAASPFVAAGKAVYEAGKEVEAAILRQDSEVQPDGYNYVYETANGIAAQSRGSLKKVDNQDVLTQEGSYSYNAPDGSPVQVSYVADENGYQPSGNVLPVGPPIPEAIARSLEWIAAHPPPVETRRV